MRSPERDSSYSNLIDRGNWDHASSQTSMLTISKACNDPPASHHSVGMGMSVDNASGFFSN